MNKTAPIIYEGSNSQLLGVLFPLSFLLFFIVYLGVDSYYNVVNPGPFIFFLGLIFFVIFIIWIVFFWLAIKKKPSLQLDEYGVTYQGFKKQIGSNLLPWDAMKNAEIRRFLRRGRLLHIQISEQHKAIIDKLPKSHKFMFGASALISIDYIKGDMEEICQEINQFIHNKQMQTDAANAAPLI